MSHEWLQTWGEAIEPANCLGSFAVAFAISWRTRRQDWPASSVRGAAAMMSCCCLRSKPIDRSDRPTQSCIASWWQWCFSEGTRGPVVLALRPDFPDTPHQNWVPDGVPFSLCIDDRPWQEARLLYTPAELLHRIMKWFERAGRGGLHDLRQPLDPFFMRQGIHVRDAAECL